MQNEKRPIRRGRSYHTFVNYARIQFDGNGRANDLAEEARWIFAFGAGAVFHVGAFLALRALLKVENLRGCGGNEEMESDD